MVAIGPEFELKKHPECRTEIIAFNAFAAELRDNLNNSISDEEIIEMLAQHLINKSVFDALFENYSFTSHNPMSKPMQAVLDILQEHYYYSSISVRFYPKRQAGT